MRRASHSSAGTRVRKEPGVGVERFVAEKNLQVPRHVDENEAEQNHAGDGHHGLFADGGVVEIQRSSCSLVSRCSSHSKPLVARVRSAGF